MPDQEAVVAITSGVYDMGKVMKLVWEILLPAMQSDVVENDFNAVAKLRARTTSLQLPPIKGETKSVNSKNVSKKKYVLQKNDTGAQAISFEINGSQPEIKIILNDGEETLVVGSSEYRSGTLQSSLPFAPSMYDKIAVSGAWTGSSEYQLRIYFYESPARLTYTFNFSR